MKSLLLLFTFTLFISSCEYGDVISRIPNDNITEQEAAMGLKDALEVGIARGSDKVAQVDGFYKHPVIKIPFPPDAMKVANTLRDIGLGSEVDRVILTINRGAEDAAAKAKPIFVDAIREMTIRDAFNILFGGDSAATNYLRLKTSDKLTAEFRPVIQNSLNQVNATKYWDDVITRYNQIPLVQKVNPDLVAYVNQKALDGLFYMVAQEEKKIREDPVARTTALLKRVFGYYDKNKNQR